MPARLIEGTHTNKGRLAVRRGPLVLAVDARLNPGIAATRVAPAAEDDGTMKLAPAADPEGLAAHAFKGEGLVPESVDDQVALKRVPLVLTSFAEAGQTGSNYSVWMPGPDQLERVSASPFLFARETYSRKGNVNGSIADGDATTFRVTYDGSKPAEDWFAVERSSPATVNAVTCAHGKTFHDGGWWDASKGKPRIQVRKAPNGPWEDVAVIEAYPATTATDPKRLRNGQEFVVTFAPTKVVGIRVIGVPACGDKPGQSFASCAELLGVVDKEKTR
jgi:hypothetical protein